MDHNEPKPEILERVSPQRRDFVKNLLAGAFAVPVIATFSIDALSVDIAEAQVFSSGSLCTPDTGYIGPAHFQAHLHDPAGKSRVHGEAEFQVQGDGHDHNTPIRSLNVEWDVTGDAAVTNATIQVNGVPVANLPAKQTSILPGNIFGLCDFDDLLQALAAGRGSVVVQVIFYGSPVTLTGAIVAKPGQVIKLPPQ